jgi:hypothetical protein
MREMIGVVALTDVMQAYGLTRIPAEWGQRAVKETGGQ